MREIIAGAKISSQYQITVPLPVRQMLKLKRQSRVVFIKEDGRIVFASAIIEGDAQKT